MVFVLYIMENSMLDQCSARANDDFIDTPETEEPWKANFTYKQFFYSGEVNRCPGCRGRSWHVGRLSAECATEDCGTTLDFEHRRSSVTDIVSEDRHQPSAVRGRFVVNGRF